MPIYTWQGLDKKGKKVIGKITATNISEARKALRAQSVRIQKITEPTIFEFDLQEWFVNQGLTKPFGYKELTAFTRQLSIMIEAGIPVLTAFEILFKSEKNQALRKTLMKVAADISEGKTIADSLEKHKGFSKFYCSLIRAGESAGILDTILKRLNANMEKQMKTLSQIKGAMTYPAIVLTVGFVVVYGLLTFVVPKFQEMLTQNGQELPAVTQFVINLSSFFSTYTIIIIPALIAGVVTFLWAIKLPGIKQVFDRFILKMPLLGELNRKGNWAYFTRTLATMLGSGISILEAIDICVEIVENSVMQKDLKNVRADLVGGKSFTEALTRISDIPDLIVSMVRVGEQTGALDKMLERIAVVFEDELDEIVTNLTKLMEPLIIVFLGGIVAVILLAMYLPIFNMAGGQGEEQAETAGKAAGVATKKAIESTN